MLVWKNAFIFSTNVDNKIFRTLNVGDQSRMDTSHVSVRYFVNSRENSFIVRFKVRYMAVAPRPYCLWNSITRTCAFSQTSGLAEPNISAGQCNYGKVNVEKFNKTHAVETPHTLVISCCGVSKNPIQYDAWRRRRAEIIDPDSITHDNQHGRGDYINKSNFSPYLHTRMSVFVF